MNETSRTYHRNMLFNIAEETLGTAALVAALYVPEESYATPVLFATGAGLLVHSLIKGVFRPAHDRVMNHLASEAPTPTDEL